jgi:DNA-binding MarR family transcriptional regulator
VSRARAEDAPEMDEWPATPTDHKDIGADAHATGPESSVREALESVRRLVRALRIAANRARDTAGISSAELFILRALEDRGPATSLNELAARTYTDQSSASPVVDRLRRRRLIRCQRATADARRLTIELTEAGRALLARAPAPPQAGVVTALRRMGADERIALARGLGQLVEEMGLAHLQAAMMFEDPPRGKKTGR